MVTTRRSFDQRNTLANNRSNVSILDREIPTEKEVQTTQATSQEKERMQRNLDMLLNYDRYQGSTEEQLRADRIVENVCSETTTFADEDINPSSTTMQFGVDSDLDREEIASDMSRASATATATRDYRLTKKGKIIIALYTLAVAVILALIIVNTGVLALLRTGNEEKVATLNDLKTSYNAQTLVNEQLQSEEHIAPIVTEWGMSK